MKKLSFTVLAALLSVLTFGQEDGGTKKVDININTKNGGGGGDWYTAPWVWVVGAAIFILLLVALTRGGRRDA